MLKKTIEKTKDDSGKTHVETIYTFIGIVIYSKVVDYALAIEAASRGMKVGA